MAVAPRPGVGARRSAEHNALKGLRITIDDETREFYPGLVTIDDKAAVRRAFRTSYEELMEAAEDAMGEDLLVLWWWLAGRHENPKLSWSRAKAEWPKPGVAYEFATEKIDPENDSDDESEGDSPEG